MNPLPQYYIGIAQTVDDYHVHVLNRYSKSVWSGAILKGDRNSISLLTATLAGPCGFALEPDINSKDLFQRLSSHEVVESGFSLLLSEPNPASRARQMANCLRLSQGSRTLATEPKQTYAQPPIWMQAPALTQRVAKLMVRLEQLEQELATFDGSDQLIAS